MKSYLKLRRRCSLQLGVGVRVVVEAFVVVFVVVVGAFVVVFVVVVGAFVVVVAPIVRVPPLVEPIRGRFKDGEKFYMLII